jgi:hypothetical protein
MLQVNPEFLKSKAPHRVSGEALAKPSQGPVWQLTPVARSNPKRRPRRVRSTPVWQAALLAISGV